MTDRRGDGGPDGRPPEEAVTEALADSTGRPLPKQIGQFHIKDVLASGGMGVVYRAVQEQPRRTVAVKVMKQGIASRSAMRRFEYESQVLARLHHPGIAQVFEAGTHDDGAGAVPYFAMEYVPNAKAITHYARQKSLGTRDRLDLFASVCDAVHHGHQKGIIHRDLKPGNILVDPNGNVKIIDFGVARGTDSDLVLTTLQTEVGQLIGTLQYMSPEQCEADPDAIDARSDVYAMGVVLYELLTGQLPYTIHQEPVFRGTKVIREQPPTKPSTIDRTLRGDVETIVLQALEKDPQRRYASAEVFAKDIRSYLNGEAIRARPPSTVYRVQLFARRHKAVLGTVAALALVSAAAALLVESSRDRARQAEDAMAEALSRAAQAEIAVAESKRVGVSEEMKATDMVGLAPAEFSVTTVDGKKVGTAEFAKHKATVLNFVAADCPYCFKQVPLVEEIRAEYEPKGIRFVNVALTLIRDFTAEEARDVFARVGSLEFAKGENEEVGDLFKVSGYPTLSIVDNSGTVRHVSIGAEDDLMARLRGQLDALILGKPTPEEVLAEAEKLHRQTLENNRQTLGEGHRDTLRSMENLAVTLTEGDKHDEAEDLYGEIWDVRRRFLGENDPQTLESMHKLAVVLQERGKPAEAEALHRQTLDLRRRVLGDDHPATRLSMAHLGMTLLDQGKTEAAEPYVAELIELRRREAQAQDADAKTLDAYAWLLLTCEPVGLRDPATALDVAKTAAKLSGRHASGILDTLALAQKTTGDLDAAIETQKEAILLLSPSDFRKRGPLEQTLDRYYREAEDLDALEAWYRDSVDQARASMPAGSLPIAGRLGNLGGLLLERERYDEAELVFRETVDIGRAGLPENHWLVFVGENALGVTLVGQGRFEEAEPLVVNGYVGIREAKGAPPDVVEGALEGVIRLYTDWGRLDEAARYRKMARPDPAGTEPGPQATGEGR